jgi:hypothetical protein
VKKIAIASAAMGGAALIAFGASGTFAAFSDSEELAGEAGAATLDLRVGTPSSPERAVALNMAPGDDTLYFPYFVKNAGDLDGLLGGEIELTDFENGCSGGEGKNRVDPTCDAGDDQGEFSSTALFGVTYAENVARARDCDADVATDVLISPTSVPANLPVRSLEMEPFVPVEAGYGICVVISVELPELAGNVVQGDSAELSVRLDLDQDTTDSNL